jgi:hypothetical protein
MSLHERLSRMVESALPGTLVPVSSLRELLENHQSETRAADPGLSLEEVAQRCAARGSTTKPVGTATVRKWIRTGLGGVKLTAFPWGTTYRVTEEAVERFILALQTDKRDARSHAQAASRTPSTIEDEIAAAEARYSRPATRRSRTQRGP